VTACEKCWSDARERAALTGRAVHECYRELLEERKDNPCPPQRLATGRELLEEAARNAGLFTSEDYDRMLADLQPDEDPTP
jgi:hypothetical protein